jgi:hypothetical protein
MYNYLQSFIQIFFDVVVFNYVFDEQELVGLFVVFAVNFAMIFKILRSD